MTHRRLSSNASIMAPLTTNGTWEVAAIKSEPSAGLANWGSRGSRRMDKALSIFASPRLSLDDACTAQAAVAKQKVQTADPKASRTAAMLSDWIRPSAAFKLVGEGFGLPAGSAKSSQTAARSCKNSAGAASPKASLTESLAARRSNSKTLACCGISSALLVFGTIDPKTSPRTLRSHNEESTATPVLGNAFCACFTAFFSAGCVANAAANWRQMTLRGPANAFSTSTSLTSKARKARSWKEKKGSMPKVRKNSPATFMGSARSANWLQHRSLALVLRLVRNRFNKTLIEPRPAIHCWPCAWMSAQPSVPAAAQKWAAALMRGRSDASLRANSQLLSAKAWTIFLVAATQSSNLAWLFEAGKAGPAARTAMLELASEWGGSTTPQCCATQASSSGVVGRNGVHWSRNGRAKGCDLIAASCGNSGVTRPHRQPAAVSTWTKARGSKSESPPKSAASNKDTVKP